MSNTNKLYCLDANVLIQAWQKYYSPLICLDYWDLLIKLGQQNKIFLPQMVYEEITRTDDDLSSWLKKSKIPIRKIDTEVSNCLKQIYAANSYHQYLVSEGGQHSMADPWVIAHALFEKATVVTKENKDNYNKPTKIKIPHVCDNMGVRWINDFQFIKELDIKFSCKI